MNDVIQFDNFAPDAAEVRERVITGEFTTEQGPDRALYTGISRLQVPHWCDKLAERLGHAIKPGLSCFRLNLKGELPHSWVHADMICAEWATVLYLNLPEQCQGGTAFWRHRELGIDRMPEGTLAEIGYDFVHAMDMEWKRLEQWEQVGVMPMQWNRLITYPTKMFHSRWPFESFGTGPADGRLIWVCFYDMEVTP